MQNMIPINTERVHVCSPDIHVAICAVIDGYIDDNKLNGARDSIEQRHPLIRATIFFDENNKAYYNLNTVGQTGITITSDDAADWMQLINESNQTHFDIRNDNLLRILILRKKSSTSIIMLGHHLLGDGLSFIYMMEDYLKALDQNANIQIAYPAIIKDKSDFPTKSQLPLIVRLIVNKLNKNYKKTGRVFNSENYKEIYNVYRQQNEPSIYSFEFTKDETAKLIASCKANKVTVNQAITTSFLYARQLCGIPSGRIGFSCSLRNELKTHPQKSHGNFVAGNIINTYYDTNTSFYENVRKTATAINKKLKSNTQRTIALTLLDAMDDNLIDSINFIETDYGQNRTAQKALDIFTHNALREGTAISNLGKVDIGLKSIDIDSVYFIPPLFPPHDLTIGILTVNSKLTMTIRYPAAKYEERLMSDLASSIKNMLLSEYRRSDILEEVSE